MQVLTGEKDEKYYRAARRCREYVLAYTHAQYSVASTKGGERPCSARLKPIRKRARMGVVRLESLHICEVEADL